MTEPSFVGLPRFRESALCAQADPEEWFPDKGQTPKYAKRVCNGHDGREPCPARDECLAWALKNAEVGVWGGLSETERRRVRVRWTA